MEEKIREMRDKVVKNIDNPPQDDKGLDFLFTLNYITEDYERFNRLMSHLNELESMANAH